MKKFKKVVVGRIEQQLNMDLDGDGRIGNGLGSGNSSGAHSGKKPHKHGQGKPGFGQVVHGAVLQNQLGHGNQGGQYSGAHPPPQPQPPQPAHHPYAQPHAPPPPAYNAHPYNQSPPLTPPPPPLLPYPQQQQNFTPPGYGPPIETPYTPAPYPHHNYQPPQYPHSGPGYQPAPAAYTPPVPDHIPRPVPYPHHGGGFGRRRALLIGINYIGQIGQLRGCVNDVSRIKSFLIQRGWPEHSMTILVDDRSWGTQMPTRANIIRAINEFVSGVQPGDALFFHYSGHGGKVKDTSGDEDDGMDETIMPLDWRTAGQIIDDELYQRLVAPLPAGSKLFALMDCCNSGTGLDLPYRFAGTDAIMSNIFSGGALNMMAIPSLIMNGKWSRKNMQKWAGQLMGAAMKAKVQAGKGGFAGVVGALTGGLGTGVGEHGFNKESKNTVRAEVVAIGGCEDMRTSADVAGPNGAGGACTTAFINALSRPTPPSYIELVESIRLEIRRRGLKQVPQLSAGRMLDMKTPVAIE